MSKFSALQNTKYDKVPVCELADSDCDDEYNISTLLNDNIKPVVVKRPIYR